MNCQACQSENPTDSKFCRECGGKLGEPIPPPAPSAEEQERRKKRVAELLPRAFAFSEKGAIAEAIATAEEAAGLLSGSSAAHALLASLYERAGQSEKAIAALRKVAELNPDAPLDEERMARLRRARAASAPGKSSESEERSPVKFWAPRLGAALAFFTVLYGGISVLRMPQDRVKTPNKLVVSEQRPGTVNTAAQLAAPVRPTFVPPPAGSAPDPFVSRSGWRPETPATGRSSEAPRRRGLEDRDPEPSSSRRRSLPRPDSPSSAAAVPPVNVVLPANRSEEPPSSERISAAPPSAPAKKSSGDGDNGYIDIKIDKHPASGGESSSGSGESKSKERGDPTTEAQALQNTGRYRDALRSWREVLASSGTRGEIYQNVGLCYQRLGERGAARDAYSRAIDVYQGQVRQGASADAALRGIDSCRAALEVLGA